MVTRFLPHVFVFTLTDDKIYTSTAPREMAAARLTRADRLRAAPDEIPDALRRPAAQAGSCGGSEECCNQAQVGGWWGRERIGDPAAGIEQPRLSQAPAATPRRGPPLAPDAATLR